MQHLNPAFSSLLRRMEETHDRKLQDYAGVDSPYMNFERAALVSSWFTDPVDRVFATLITVKMARLAELKGTGKAPNNEPIADTHLDLANYAAIWAARSGV